MKKLSVFLLASAIIFSGCSASYDGISNDSVSSESMPSEPIYSQTAGSHDFGGEMSYDEEFDIMTEESKSETNILPEGESVAADVEDFSEKLIYTGSLHIEALEFDSAIDGLEAKVEGTGGFIESSSSSGYTYYDEDDMPQISDRRAYYTVRIPSDTFKAFLDDASQFGNVTDSSTSVDNITMNYYDTEARLKSYEAQYDRLLELLEIAESLEDILTIENQLSYVRYEMERLTTTLKGYDLDVDYSTINITVQEVTKYTPPEKESYFDRISGALSGSFEDFGDFLADFSIWLIYAAPYFVVIIIVITVGKKVCPKFKIKKPFSKKKGGGDNEDIV